MSDAVRIIPADPPGHDCADFLPSNRGGYGSTGQPDGTIAVCPCGKAWFSGPCYADYGPTEQWRRVMPWHLRLRARLDGPGRCNCGWGGTHDPDNPRCDRNATGGPDE